MLFGETPDKKDSIPKKLKDGIELTNYRVGGTVGYVVSLPFCIASEAIGESKVFGSVHNAGLSLGWIAGFIALACSSTVTLPAYLGLSLIEKLIDKLSTPAATESNTDIPPETPES